MNKNGILQCYNLQLHTKPFNIKRVRLDENRSFNGIKMDSD